MPTAIKSAAEIADKFVSVTPGRRADYEQGVRNPVKDWETETAKAEGRYEEGVQASIARKGFGKGVSKAGTSKWQDAAITKGVSRWPQGVSAAGPAYQEGFAPYRDVIANVTPPPRRPAGDPGNIDRVTAYTVPLHKKKIAG